MAAAITHSPVTFHTRYDSKNVGKKASAPAGAASLPQSSKPLPPGVRLHTPAVAGQRETKLFLRTGFHGGFNPLNSCQSVFLAGSNDLHWKRKIHAAGVGIVGSAAGGAMGSEMNIFSRVARILRSVVEGAVSSAEDPEKILDQVTEEMAWDLGKLRMTSAQVVANKRILEDKYNRAISSSNEWYSRARRALEQGDESVAREALKRRKALDDNARSLKAQLNQQTEVADRILSSSRALERKIGEARSKKDTLKARAQSAKSSKYVTDMLGSIDTSSALAAYERMEEKVSRLEAESDALTQISSDSLATKFAELEGEDVSDDLLALKQDVYGSNDLFRRQDRARLPERTHY